MIDCLVVGAGQSGLTCADRLAAAGLSYLVTDENSRVGHVWRSRPRSLRLFTSRQFCQLDDIPMPGAPDGFPGAVEFADYLEQFASRRALHIRLNCRVVRLTWCDDAFVATFASGEIVHARTVIDATGSNQRARVPPLAQCLDQSVLQLTAASYRDPDSAGAPGTVLVVGDGASGRQIAHELAGTRKVILSMGRARKLIPNVFLGHDVFWWLSKIGVLYAPTASFVARIIRKRDPIPANNLSNHRLRAAGVVLKPRTSGAIGARVSFSDGSLEQISAVIWCAGYEEELGWIELPDIDIRNEQIQHQRGKTAQPGFFVVGRKWLSCRASELVLGIAIDAKIVIDHVVQHIGRSGEGTSD